MGDAAIKRVLAPNPSALTLDGTNTWVVGVWVVDPGPALEAHIDAIRSAAPVIEGVVLTHSHLDHSEAAPLLDAPVYKLADGDSAGPFTAIATPGHSSDSVCLLCGRALFTGDTVLGEGSVFVSPGEGSLSAYMASLEKLLKLNIDAIYPGHVPVISDPKAKLREYLDHRRERERLVLAALDGGARSRDELLDQAWSDVDFSGVPLLRVAAAASLAAHLQKLAEEGRLPAGVPAEAMAGPDFGGQ